MKALFVTFFSSLLISISACAFYDPDYEYFNLFTQEIIPDKEYVPFLLTYSEPYYSPIGYELEDENTLSWQNYFDQTINYIEMDAILKLVDIKHFRNLKKGNRSHNLFKKLPAGFEKKYAEGIDYLLEAKYLEPYMRIIPDPNSQRFYYDEEPKNVSELDFDKTSAELKNLYNTTNNPEIKLRYGYQLVRFYHYNRKYKEAIEVFNTYVELLKNDSPIYWYALDQKAGAEKGMGNIRQANWDFFQVFIHSKNKKTSAYNSIKLYNSTEMNRNENFNEILSMCRTTEEKNMAYFLLGYNDFSNPIGIMQKMYEIDPNSPILKVLTARAINQLERMYLPLYMSCDYGDCKIKSNKIPTQSPISNYMYSEDEDFLSDLHAFLNQSKIENSPFWAITKAYTYFLSGEYTQSDKILEGVKTSKDEYTEQIQRLKMLNEIVSIDSIDSSFEQEIYEKYSQYLEHAKGTLYYEENGTIDFIRDVLANRYFLQKDYAKSFLLNNSIFDLQYNPNVSLIRDIHDFYLKSDKNKFEKWLSIKIEWMQNPSAYFNVFYGDQAMRNADFVKAKEYYSQAQGYPGIIRYHYEYEYQNDIEVAQLKLIKIEEGAYNGFENISSLIFGHNVWESFESPPEISMKDDIQGQFSLIPKKMNKLELAEILIQLEKIGKSNDSKNSVANQLIGNVMYNTSILGYYREVFLMDINNANGEKFHFRKQGVSPFHFYFKNYTYHVNIQPDNFDLAIKYYSQALHSTKDKEQKARILFQMASAEQGKYYQFVMDNYRDIDYTSSTYDQEKEQQEQYFIRMKNSNYRSYFQELKSNFSDTKTYKNLRGSCSYFKYYTSK